MKISYVSDLHMECGIKDVILPGGDVLLLPGDLIQLTSITTRDQDTWHKFFNEEVAKYTKAFYVLGNHEHYCTNISTTLGEMIKHLPKNVEIMENHVFPINDDWMIFGATLWTDYANNTSNAKDAARICMNDHRLIAITRRTTADGYKPIVGVFKPEDAYDRNQSSKQYLYDALVEYPDKKFIVMTHHTPSMRSGHPRWGGSDNWLNFAFHNTDLDTYIQQHPNIKYWVHGHTHDSCDYTIGQCRVLCNPKGYGKENKHFDCTKSFDLDTGVAV